MVAHVPSPSDRRKIAILFREDAGVIHIWSVRMRVVETVFEETCHDWIDWRREKQVTQTKHPDSFI
jgi:hypothetical protein